MDSIHKYGKPLHADPDVIYVVLLQVWITYSKQCKKNGDLRPSLQDLFTAIQFDDRHFIIDVIVPQQPNSYDCGLYVLKFFEALLEERPQKSKIGTQYSGITITNLDCQMFRAILWSSLRQFVSEE
jgi:hypothetical protein